ncbi:MAG TPA: orotidine 5'-phosphate decarboxylase / HUMPS family protein [archaeon]|nr:orotidine 5'-phosphate decarboxylase / HUMPS family protein [archaeon]
MKDIIPFKRSVIPACDMDELSDFASLVKAVDSVKGIGGYKVGFELGLKYGLPQVVNTARKYTMRPIIYDHQKAATDVPFTGEKFAQVCFEAGIDAVILFPQAGPVTEKEWIKQCQKAGLGVIVGGEMTHESYLKSDGGFLEDSAPMRMYEIAAQAGVRDFVVPGNKPEKISKYKKHIESFGVAPVLYSPGLISQGGEISESAKAAGEKWHAIVGRAIYESKNMKKAAIEQCAQLLL